MSGPELPGFTFVSKLGSGGYSDVLLYEQHRPKRPVAIKVMHASFSDRQLELFTAEADTMAQLADHPYIVPVLAADIAADGRPYLVMQYFPPPDLGARVAAKPLQFHEALRTGIQICSAVETAHRAGILHRDIKPPNILVSTYGTPALTDFGIAGTLHEPNHDDDVGVSIPWAAPEVLNGRSNGTVASDVYSLGATIWNLLTGRSPFRGTGSSDTNAALMMRIYQNPPPPTGAEVPPALDRLLQQAMSKDPAHRPRTAYELAQGLASIEGQAGLSRTDIVVLGAISPVVTPLDAGAPSTTRRPQRPEPVGAAPAAPVPIHDTGETQLRGQAPPSATPDATILRRMPQASDPTVAGDRPAIPPTPAKIRQWRWLGVAAVAIAAVGGGALALSGGDEPRESAAKGPTAPSTPDALTSGAFISIDPPEVAGRSATFTIRRHGTFPAGTALRWVDSSATQAGGGADGDRAVGVPEPLEGDRVTLPLTAAGKACVTVRIYADGASEPSDSESRCTS